MDRPPDSQGSEQHIPRQAQPLQRVPTGIGGLDSILQGGFLTAGIYLIAGQPGSGKTVLSSQIAFNHAAAGGNVVFVSVLSETHSRLFRNLSSFSFFNQEHIGGKLLFIGGHGVAQKDGLPGLLALLQRVVRDKSATLLIIDGVVNAEAVAPSELGFKEFVHHLQVFAEFIGCTVLLLSTAGGQESGVDQVTAKTIVEGLIQLSRKRAGGRLVRELEVLKFRGSGFLEGAHSIRITEHGISVHPRTEALLGGSQPAHEEPSATPDRLAFGVEQLDGMLAGGLLAGSTTMLLGPPGSGKTMLGLHFLAAGGRAGQRGLYFGLNERPARLTHAADRVGLDFRGLVAAGQIQALWHPSVEATLDVLAEQLLGAVREQGVARLFVDGIDVFDDDSLHHERMAPFLRAITGELSGLGVTTLLSVELNNLFGPTVDIPLEGVSALVDNIIFLRYAELRSQLYRLISILKTRGSGYDTAIREFRISAKGIEVAATFESAEAMLTGLARPLPTTATGREE